MKNLFITGIGRFRLISILEGISFLVLLGIAMPAKYVYDNPVLIKPVGMTHGVLFLLYLAVALFFAVKQKWNFKTTSIVLVASVLPFGTFFVDRIILRKIKN
ncbi:MAG: DUF3817 domain-containing protein [Flavobacteriales bacterium]